MRARRGRPSAYPGGVEAGTVDVVVVDDFPFDAFGRLRRLGGGDPARRQQLFGLVERRVLGVDVALVGAERAGAAGRQGLLGRLVVGEAWLSRAWI